MISRILILGGYGNFGAFISKTLASEKNIQLIINGRNSKKAQMFADCLSRHHPDTPTPEVAIFDIHSNLKHQLSILAPDIVIHTSGPFQAQSYDVAQACIDIGCHYIDLADSRSFVINIDTLNQQAKEKEVTVISGASSVPCLTSALVDEFQTAFKELHELDYGISTAQKTTRGLATTAAILSYTGKPFTSWENRQWKTVYGWQGLRIRHYKKLGWRLMSRCNIPDLTLFPKRYPHLQRVEFNAGLEIPFIHLTLWSLSWLVRIGLIKNLQHYAPLLLKTSFLFDFMGSNKSGFHMQMKGITATQETKTLTFELTALSGHGPYIPCMPAIILAQKLSKPSQINSGAYPCIGVISKDEYLDALKGYDITWSLNEN